MVRLGATPSLEAQFPVFVLEQSEADPAEAHQNERSCSLQNGPCRRDPETWKDQRSSPGELGLHLVLEPGLGCWALASGCLSLGLLLQAVVNQCVPRDSAEATAGDPSLRPARPWQCPRSSVFFFP